MDEANYCVCTDVAATGALGKPFSDLGGTEEEAGMARCVHEGTCDDTGRHPQNGIDLP